MKNVRDSKNSPFLFNAFEILGLSPDATVESISEALEDGLGSDPSNEHQLTTAKDALVRPKSRLVAELNSLLDTPKSAARAIMRQVRSDGSSSDALIRTALPLAPISRSNLLTHVAETSAPFDGALFVALIDAWAAFDTHEILKSLTRVHKAAAFPAPAEKMVGDLVQELRRNQAERATASFADQPDQAAATMKKAVSAILMDPDPKRIEAAEILLSEYSKQIDRSIQNRRNAIFETLEALLKNTSGVNDISKFKSQLMAWDELSQPLQLMEGYKGRDEPGSREVFEKVRSSLITIANESKRFDLAFEINETAISVFAELPRAHERLTEDRVTLEENLVFFNASSLIEFGENWRDHYPDLSKSLSIGVFGIGSVGSAKILHQAFLKAVAATTGKASADMPFAIIRSIAIDINNEFDDPKTASVLIDGLISSPNFPSAGSEIRQQLAEDRRVAKRNSLQAQILKSAKDNDNASAIAALKNLEELSDTPEERMTFAGTRSVLEKKESKRKLNWVWLAAGAAFFIWIAVSNNEPRRPNRHVYNPPTSPTALPSPPPITLNPVAVNEWAEQAPNKGSNLVLSVEGIRYCKFESERLSHVRTRISDDLVDRFNTEVNDYNSRCGSYRYRDFDMSIVNSQLEGRRTFLQVEALARIKAWQRQVTTPPVSSYPEAAPSVPTADPVQSPKPVESADKDVPTDENTQHETQLDLLDPQAAQVVQDILIDLGYLPGLGDGTWGPSSRSALYRFKVSNGLASDDVLDNATIKVLFSGAGSRNDPSRSLSSPYKSASRYPAIDGGKLNPLNTEDAAIINRKLRELGFYDGTNERLWSGKSREALVKFSRLRGLDDRGIWTAAHEQSLFEG